MESIDPPKIPEASDATAAGDPAEILILDEPSGDPPPRLGIIHLLAWITIAAVLFGIENWVQRVEDASGNPDKYPVLYRNLSFVHLSMISAGIVGLSTLLRWRYRNNARRLEPGHWLLIGNVIPSLFGLAVSIGWRMCRISSELGASQFWNTVFIAIFALVALAQIAVYIVALRCEVSRGWRRMFVLLAISRTADVMIYSVFFLMILHAGFIGGWFTLSQSIARVIQTVVTVVFWIFAVYDAFRIRRDWLHGLGVGLDICQGLVSLGTWALATFLR